MKQLYLNMTGEKLLRKIGKTASLRIFRDILILVCVGFLAVGMVLPIFENFKENFWAMFLLPLWFLGIYYPIMDITKQIRTFRHRENDAIFSRYGTPDDIAAVLADPDNEQLLPCKRIILTRGYLMHRNDFQTYIPLADIAALSAHAKSGRYPCVYLTVWTRDGLQKVYRTEEISFFRSVTKSYQAIADVLSEVLPIYAPDCRFML